MVPHRLIELTLHSYHENLCHVESEKMYNSIRQKYYWPMMYVDVHNWTKTCIDSQTGKSGVAHKAPLKPTAPPASVFEVCHVNHILLPKSKGYKYALVLVDSLSLFPILLPAKTAGADEIAKLLYDDFFMTFGARVLLSHRGAALKSKLTKALCSLLETTQVFISRHRQTNSRAESYKNILNSLRTKCNSEKDWPDMLYDSFFFLHLCSKIFRIFKVPDRIR